MRWPSLVLVVALGGCGGGRPADLATTTPFDLARTQGRFVAVHGLHVFAITTGGGRDVVLVHGNPASTYTWRKLIPGLAQRYRVHALDLPGFGFSDKPADAPYDAAWLADALLGYLDAARVPRAVLVGNSMGGEVVTELAIAHPERVSALVLLGAAGLPEAEVETVPLLYRLLGWPIVGRVLRAVPSRRFTGDGLRHAVYDPATITAEDVDAYDAPLRTAGGLNAFVARLGRRTPATRAERVATIAAPALVVTGDTDRLIPPATARRYQELIPASQLLVLEKTGHLPQEECPERMVTEITRWMDAHP
mgnify:FL=1